MAESKRKYEYASEYFWSNCIIEAVKAWLKDPKNVKIYYLRPYVKEDGTFRQLHVVWTDGKYSYDFSDDDWYSQRHNPHLWYKGLIRRWPADWAEDIYKRRNELLATCRKNIFGLRRVK